MIQIFLFNESNCRSLYQGFNNLREIIDNLIRVYRC